MHGSIKERGVLQTLDDRGKAGKAEGLELSGLGHRGRAQWQMTRVHRVPQLLLKLYTTATAVNLHLFSS
jgi:hypothetical protein